ncbi:MAG: riboflavin synthase [Vicinamibacterales bacterium]
MFTGLIEAMGEVAAVAPSTAGSRLRIETALDGALSPGDSLAVNGVCLTVVTAAAGAGIEMDVSPVTARITTMGSVTVGTILNLERSLCAAARLGGHFVQGHVDATGVLVSIEPQGESYWLTVAYPEELTRYLVKKGSVAVDGISLTVADLTDRQFAVQIIPFTWQHTNLHVLTAGAAVNLESDILGKYVVRALEAGLGQPAQSSGREPKAVTS